MVEQRLTILLQGGVIDQDIYDNMLDVVHILEEFWLIPVRHPQGEMALTHMASAFMRSRRGEIVSPIEKDILDKIKQSGNYSRLLKIHHSLLEKFTLTLHPNEEGYLLINLYGLILATTSY
ncbi:PRD domain-containing protein [Xenorhabdus stockiae]|uniref:PRD domain-containing protein n=1 Tax=Xenorhabdus stockiae TaxID=351614 RepID=A0A2D0KQD7_9GAMM|nr:MULTISPECIES: PRD domain-containing protein [Xenorhabdus]PHM65608.1 PRD domain-containing protein [Xenorhabdus stockiae]PHM70857.1 PRD domain-containing protein [Xenorhabdus sp. KJ12.1]